MNTSDKDNNELINYLLGFVTPERWSRFNNVITNRTRHLTVVIENVFQPHNISAVLRSCECFGLQDVHIIDKNNYFEINTEIELGASKWLNINLYNDENQNNTIKCIESLKTEGYRVIATSPHINDCNLDELNIDNKTALIFGKELEGLSEDAKEMADGFMKIPMYGFTESFNISVTAALCMHHITSKLRDSSVSWKLSEQEKAEVLINWLKKSIKNSEMIIKQFFEKKQ